MRPRIDNKFLVGLGVLLFFLCPSQKHRLMVAHGLHAQWFAMPSSTSRIVPRRSGHVSFGLSNVGEEHFVFGGYGETIPDEHRHVVNDLWKWRKTDHSTSSYGWELLTDATGDIPTARLVAAAATLSPPPSTPKDDSSSSLSSYAYLIGGWDPGTPGTGGAILDSCYKLDLNTHHWTRLENFPDGPTSRHVAVVVNGNYESSPILVVHNHRCTKHVWILDGDSDTFVKQGTTGIAPSPRGLHAACNAGSKFVVFGGAAQDGTMSNEVFVLDTPTWTWTQLDINSPSSPSPRAAPCLVTYKDDCVLLFGGAEATPAGLNPRGDVWALHLDRGEWELLLDDVDKKDEIMVGSTIDAVRPPPRNAATMMCIRGDSKSKEYLLTGGWHPFVETWDDCYVLRVQDE